MIKEKKILFPLVFLFWKIVGDSLNKLGDSAAFFPGQFLYSVGLLEMWMPFQNVMLLSWVDFSKSCYAALWVWVWMSSSIQSHRPWMSAFEFLSVSYGHGGSPLYAGWGGLSDFEMSSFYDLTKSHWPLPVSLVCTSYRSSCSVSQQDQSCLYHWWVADIKGRL